MPSRHQNKLHPLRSRKWRRSRWIWGASRLRTCPGARLRPILDRLMIGLTARCRRSAAAPLTQGGNAMLTLKKRPARQEQTQSQTKPPLPERLAAGETAPDDQIRPLAYRKSQDAGSPAGDGIEFWLAAEKEIRRGRRGLLWVPPLRFSPPQRASPGPAVGISLLP